MFNNMNQNQPQLESKNLSILEDQLNYEALAFKKCDAYAGYFMDPALKSTAQKLAQHHKSNYDSLLNYLNSHQ